MITYFFGEPTFFKITYGDSYGFAVHILSKRHAIFQHSISSDGCFAKRNRRFPRERNLQYISVETEAKKPLVLYLAGPERGVLCLGDKIIM